MDADPNEKRELIGLLGQNLLLDGNEVQITLYKPFSTLASCVDGSLWLPAYDSLIATAMELDGDTLLQELAEVFQLNGELLTV